MNNMTTVRNAIARFSDSDLRTARSAIEAEMIAFCATGMKGTQAHVGQLEMLEAIGAELDDRGALLPPPPFVDVCQEDGIRYSITVRVW